MNLPTVTCGLKRRSWDQIRHSLTTEGMLALFADSADSGKGTFLLGLFWMRLAHFLPGGRVQSFVTLCLLLPVLSATMDHVILLWLGIPEHRVLLERSPDP